MINIIQNIAAFVVALGVLITFHEFGHYWVAKRFDVKIKRFSIGFGRALYRRRFGSDHTEFVVAMLPLGGYVKMLDEHEEAVAAADKHRAFNQKPLGQRTLIVIAGPAFNFIFAIAAYWLVFMIGVSGLKPLIGEVVPQSVSASAGLLGGDEIIAINTVKTATWPVVIDRLVKHTVDGDNVSIDVVASDGIKKSVRLDLAQISIDDIAKGQLLERLGLMPMQLTLPPIIDRVLAGGAAESSGLLAGDEIISVNDVPIAAWSDWVKWVRDNPSVPLTVTVLRQAQTLTITVIPDRIQDQGITIGRIGVSTKTPEHVADYFAKQQYALLPALTEAVTKTWELSLLTLRLLAKMLLGEASLKNLSGPISIAQYAGQSANIGWVAFLSFMAIISISLGVLNLLPIPLLDGGHLLYYLIEFITGKPLTDNTLLLFQKIGLCLLLGLMTLAFYNDIARLVG